MDSSVKKNRLKRIPQFLLALVGLYCCYSLGVESMGYGLSRLYTAVAVVQSSLDPANKAVRFSPKDPEAHYARALTLANLGRLDEAVLEFEKSVQLRPHHYYEWLDLGVTRERLGDHTGAVAALNESVRLAPFFSQPRWQLGNLLFREGRYREAFEQMRLAAKSNPTSIEAMLDLGWVAASGDVGQLEALIQPENGRSHLQLARFLAKHGKGVESARHVRAAGQPRDEEERNLIHETISALLALGSLSEALDVWSLSHPSSRVGKGEVVNPDFVDSILADDPGFGWQLRNLPNVLVSIDPSGPTANTRSLRIEFSGENAAASSVIDQLILLDSSSNYVLSFLSKADKLVSGGPPVVVVLDADRESPKTLAQSKPLSPGSGDWSAYTVEFSTAETTSGIVLSLQRLPCTNPGPCPVFGKLWLSRFALRKI